ncbi:MAG: histidine phosphatase family protein [Pseudomonadota bacterium]
MAGSRLFFVRHGQTDWNVSDRFQGASDIPLNAEGRLQCVRLGQRLAAYFEGCQAGQASLSILTSPLQRALESARIISRELELNSDRLLSNLALRELSFGAWEGMTTHEVKAADPNARKARKSDRWSFAPPDGEAPVSRILELRAFLDAIRPPAVIVTHTVVIRICFYILGFWGEGEALTEPISQDKIYIVSNGALAEI